MGQYVRRRLTISEQQEKPATPQTDRVHYRRHRGACCFYRENWSTDSDAGAPGEHLLYQIICLWDTPPVTDEEQQRCLHAAGGCWRANHPGCGMCRNGQEAAKGSTRGRRNGKGATKTDSAGESCPTVDQDEEGEK